MKGIKLGPRCGLYSERQWGAIQGFEHGGEKVSFAFEELIWQQSMKWIGAEKSWEEGPWGADQQVGKELLFPGLLLDADAVHAFHVNSLILSPVLRDGEAETC